MQKITIIFEDQIPCSSFKTKVVKEGVMEIEEVLQFLEEALKEAGYFFEGKLKIEEK